MYQFLPELAKNGNLEIMLGHVNSAHLKKKLLHHFEKFSSEDIYICHAPSSLKFLEGKSLEEYALNNNLEADEALLKLMKLSHLQIVFSHRIVDLELLEEFLISPSSFIASGEVGLPNRELKKGCGFRVFTDFISWVKKENKISMEKAVAKITSQPAAKYKIKKRGLIKEGYYADVVVLRDEKPSDILVNGQIVLREGDVSQILAGRVLRAGI